MQYMRDYESFDYPGKTAVTLGKFDGLHRGHQKLVDRIVTCASEDDEIKSVVFSFDMRDFLLQNGVELRAVMTAEEQKKHLENQVDYLISYPFSDEICHMQAEEFIEKILVNKLHAVYIAVGSDFRFGHDKRGDVYMLEAFAEEYGYEVEIVEKERYNDRIISSTYIREELEKGNVDLAEKLLGYRYSVSGIVEHGNKIGRTLGFPTMNIAPERFKLMPKFGVYACEILLEGKLYHGIGNVGVKPTVENNKRLLVEVFVFDFNKDTYEKNIEVRFCAFERAETKFHSLDELKEQVDKDILYGRNYFEKILAMEE